MDIRGTGTQRAASLLYLVIGIVLWLSLLFWLRYQQQQRQQSLHQDDNRKFDNDNGLGKTPPMGWNSWNKFHCDGLDEDLIKDIANAMIDTGLHNVGYSYINLDDCWQVSRDKATNQIQADPTKFPSGIPALSGYIHNLGLKFGLYSDAGFYTCAHRPGSLGYEDIDAQTYAGWQIDYLKYDNCNSGKENVHTRYQTMHDALKRTGHPIFFSMCEWGVEDPATWASSIGNSWRTTGDIGPSWDSFTKIADQNNKWHDYAGPNKGWNDPDMLEVGNGHLTLAEQKSHFTLWCLMKAPLLLGNDLRSMSNETLSILSNMEIIALNQDPVGVQGYKRHTSNNDKDLEVWAGPLSGGQIAVVLFNRSMKSASITAQWKDIGIDSPDKQMLVRDLWAHKGIGIHTNYVEAMVESHGIVAYRLKPVASTRQPE